MTDRLHLTAQELADLQLPGLPSTKRGIHKFAERAEWAGRQRKARGGGREYPISALPREAREALAVREIDQTLPLPAEPQAPVELGDLKGWQRQCMEARLALISEVERLDRNGYGLQVARDRVATLAQAGELPGHLQSLVPVANQRGGKNGSRTLSASNLRRWHAEYHKHGAVGLAPKPSPRDQTAPPEWLYPFLKVYCRPGKPSVAWCHELAQREEDLSLPPLRTVQRTISSLPAVVRERGRMGPRELKAIRPYVIRDFSKLLPGDVYAADGHTADFEVMHPQTGRPFRPEIVTVVDVGTRAAVGFSAGIAEGAWMVADAIRNAATTCCIPAVFYVDRGKGFVNQHLGDAVTGVLGRLGVTLEKSLPYNSQARGVIERLHQTLWIRTSRTELTFVGHDMDREARQRVFKQSRKAVASGEASDRHMTWLDFLDHCREQIRLYNERPHTSLPKVTDADGRRRHRSPNEAWAAALADGFEPVFPDPSDADDLFRPYEERVCRRGSVQINKATYSDRALEAYHGCRVLVGYDIHDPDRVWVRDGDHRLICVADIDAHKVDFMPLSRIEMARRTRADGQIKRLDRKRDQIVEERDGEVIDGDGGEVIDIASVAPPEQRTDVDATVHAEVVADFEAARQERLGNQETGKDRFRFWLAINKRIESDLPVSDDEHRLWRSYQETPEFLGNWQLFEDFGEAWLETAG